MKFQPNFVFAWKRSSKPNVSLQVLHQNSWKYCLTVLLLTLLLPNTNSCSWYDTFLVFFRDAPRHLGQSWHSGELITFSTFFFLINPAPPEFSPLPHHAALPI